MFSASVASGATNSNIIIMFTSLQFAKNRHDHAFAHALISSSPSPSSTSPTSPSPSCPPLYTPGQAWSYRLSTPHHHHQCHHHHHHVHLFTLLDRHGHANPLVLVLALLDALLTALHLRCGLALLFHLLEVFYYWCNNVFLSYFVFCYFKK